MWGWSIVLSTIPSFLLSIFGYGMLQVSGLSFDNVMFADFIINTLYIGSGTKPIHDLIEKIKINEIIMVWIY